ncbi:spore coat protein YlbD [Virgibacillus sp. MG-45]|uniref:spore coat protein YlbD n=1 Tax=Virgibacillus sp. MG-45 TaxID=3102791 RepID=UPI002ED880DA
MDEKKLHPTVREFKEFINKHPKLIEEIRKKRRGWQEYYEKWVLLGEDDSFWEQYQDEENTKKSTEKKKELFKQIKKLTENVDVNKVQSQAKQLNSTIATLQELLGQFQSTNKNPPPLQNQRINNWQRD